MAHPGGHPAKIETAEQMQRLIDDYFKTIKKEKRPATIAGLASHIGLTSRQSLDQYGERPEFFDIVRAAKLKVETAHAEKCASGTGNPTGPIFLLKANFGLRDQIDLSLMGANGKPIAIRTETVDSIRDGRLDF